MCWQTQRRTRGAGGASSAQRTGEAPPAGKAAMAGGGYASVAACTGGYRPLPPLVAPREEGDGMMRLALMAPAAVGDGGSASFLQQRRATVPLFAVVEGGQLHKLRVRHLSSSQQPAC